MVFSSTNAAFLQPVWALLGVVGVLITPKTLTKAEVTLPGDLVGCAGHSTASESVVGRESSLCWSLEGDFEGWPPAFTLLDEVGRDGCERPVQSVYALHDLSDGLFGDDGTHSVDEYCSYSLELEGRQEC